MIVRVRLSQRNKKEFFHGKMTKEIPRLIRLNVLAVDMDGGGLNPPPSITHIPKPMICTKY